MPSAADSGEASAPARVHILLSTYNGAAWLDQQLASIAAQTCRDWVLHWRDDGSSDATGDIMRAFIAGEGRGRCVQHADTPGNIGVLASYMGLLREVEPRLRDIDALAFADQDDVWLPGKLDRAVVALAWQTRPSLYCARYAVVDAALRPIGESARLRRPAGFPAALTQNVATGCTIVLNRAAARVIAASRPPPDTLHDWWSYIVVTAAGGQLLRDEAVVVRYRQHAANAVGVAPGPGRRALAALRRGPGRFMALLRAHVAALRATPGLLDPQTRLLLERIEAALRGARTRRLVLLREAGLRRQGGWETAAFRLWLMLG